MQATHAPLEPPPACGGVRGVRGGWARRCVLRAPLLCCLLLAALLLGVFTPGAATADGSPRAAWRPGARRALAAATAPWRHPSASASSAEPRRALRAALAAPHTAAPADARAWAGDPPSAMGAAGGLSAVFLLAGSVRSAKASRRKSKDGDTDAEAAAAAAPPHPPSRRLRHCSAGLSTFVVNLFAPFLPEPAPPAPRVVVVNGIRMGPDGKTPLRLPRKARAEQTVLDEQKEAAAQLQAIGINPKEGMLKYMSPARLKLFYELLDAPKKHIFRKAPKIANTLAMKLLEECCRPSLMSVALPWGAKKGNNQSATIQLKIVDPPYNPADRTPRAGQLRLSVETDSAGKKSVTITALSANTGPDNVIALTCGIDGTVLLSTTDEPARWKWVLALNAGLHRVAAIRCMMDQAAAVMPWHPSASVTEEEPE